MCGRASINRPLESIQQIASIPRLTNQNQVYETSENCCPGMKLPIVYSNISGDRDINMMLWGLENSSRKDKITNARLETIDELQTFKPLLKNNRCVLIIDGFYEWKTVLGEKLPYFFFEDNNDNVLKVAALYKVMESYPGDNSERLGFTVLTSPSGSGMKWLHHRQPVLLSDEEMNLWLNCNEININEILPNLKESMESKLDNIKYHQVTPKLNSTSYRGSDCRIPKRSTTTPIGNFFKVIKTPPISPTPSQDKTTPISNQSTFSQEIFKSNYNNIHNNNNNNNCRNSLKFSENINSSTTIFDNSKQSYSSIDNLSPNNNNNNNTKKDLTLDHIIINDDDDFDKICCPMCNSDITNLEIDSRNHHSSQCTGKKLFYFYLYLFLIIYYIGNEIPIKTNNVKSPIIKSNNDKRKSNITSPLSSKKKSKNNDTNSITSFFGIKK
jgi:putative SOS response-associated peptidase YedK